MNIEKWSLQMFAEGGEGATAPAGGSEGTNEGGAPAQEKLSFDDLMKDADYSKEFEKRVSRRTGYEVRKAERESRAKLSPMYEALARKYDMDTSDPAKIDLEALSQKVLDDSDMLEDEAAKMGVTVDGLRKIRTAERQLQEVERIRQEEESQRAWQSLMAEGEQLKALYPGFDMETELANPQFERLLASLQANGFPNPVRTAYESAHRDEVMIGAMQYAVQRTKQQVANSIQAGAQRPAENGGGSAAQTHIDPSKLDRKQRQEIRERVMRGEHITFR